MGAMDAMKWVEDRICSMPEEESIAILPPPPSEFLSQVLEIMKPAASMDMKRKAEIKLGLQEKSMEEMFTLNDRYVY